MKRQRAKFPWDLYWENKTYKPDAYKVVITKGYGVRATTIEGQNAFAPALCFLLSSSDYHKLGLTVIKK